MQKITRALTAMAVILNEPMSQERLSGYLMILKDYPEDDVVQAIGAVTKSCDFFPKPAKIIEEISAIGTRRTMIGEPDDVIEQTDQDRAEVTDLLAGFKKRMGWD